MSLSWSSGHDSFLTTLGMEDRGHSSLPLLEASDCWEEPRMARFNSAWRFMWALVRSLVLALLDKLGLGFSFGLGLV